jgi:hypothetical protein
VRVRHPLGEADHEPPVVIELLGRRLALEHIDRVANVLQRVLLQLLGGVVARVVDLRLGRDDLVEQLAGAVLLARLGICLPDRERLPEGPALRGRDDDDPGARRSLEHRIPLLLGEVGLSGHPLAPFATIFAPAGAPPPSSQTDAAAAHPDRVMTGNRR